MNKRNIILPLLLALAWATGWAQAFTWRIEGKVAHAAPIDTLIVIDAEKQKMIATL